MTTPTDPLAARLLHLLPPASPADQPPATLGHYDLLRERLTGRIALIEAVRLRFPRLPDPPARASLQEFVQAGRRALREERAGADIDELQARLSLVEQFRLGLQP